MDWGNHKSEKRKVDWDTFETVGNDGEDDFVIKNPLMARLFHGLMVSLGLALIFVVGGGIFWFVLSGPNALAITRAKSGAIGWGQFGFGGVVTVAWILKKYFKRCRWE